MSFYISKGKDKVRFSLCIPRSYVGECRDSTTCNLVTSWSGHFLCPGHFTWERNSTNHCTRVGGPQSWSGSFGEGKKLLPLPEIEKRFFSNPACSLVSILAIGF
jgi:hypothetical protein